MSLQTPSVPVSPQGPFQPPAGRPIPAPTAPSAANVPPGKKKKKHVGDFWRACRFLYPHRRIILVSIICALGVGATSAGGITMLLPILRLLVNGDTLQNYVARTVAEKRLGISLADAPEVIIATVTPGGAIAQAGLGRGAVRLIGAPENADPATVSATLRVLCDPAATEAHLVTDSKRELLLNLPPVRWYWADLLAIANRMPINPVAALAVVLGTIFVIYLVGNVGRFFQEYYSDKAAILAVNDIRRKLYNHVLHIPMGFFGLKGTSDVTSRLVQDSQGLQEGFKTVLGQSIQEPIKAAMAFGLAIWFDWQLTLAIVLFAPVMVVIIQKFGKKMRRASRKALQSSAVMLGQLEGTLIGIRVVKAGIAERFERRRYTGIMRGLIGEQLRMSRIDAFSTPTLETATYVVVCIIVLYATYLVRIRHTLKPETFMLLMACLMSIGESLRKFSKVNNALQKSNSAAARIFETLDVPVEAWRQAKPPTATGATVPRPALRNIPSLKSEIRFEGLSFTYPNATSPALNNVDLTVPRGQSIAVVGRNGSGKTTLLALLPRFYDPQAGRILIDGVDIRSATLRSLRRQIGIVTQDAVIFPGTIHDNIAYGQPRATREQVIAAAKRAFAHEFILEKPNGYDSVLGEHGAQLSGGQRQRLCIARAILRQTPILILDEATSQVDAESEHLIQQAIESLMHERTTFVIAHRFSTILSADTIVVLERGEIVGHGPHQQLLADCPVYKQLYERQLFSSE